MIRISTVQATSRSYWEQEGRQLSTQKPDVEGQMPSSRTAHILPISFPSTLALSRFLFELQPKTNSLTLSFPTHPNPFSNLNPLALLLSISRAPLITGSSTSPNNPVFSGFQPDCQTCLDDAVQLCNDNNSFNDFCICASTGTGYSAAFDTCPGICGRDDRNRGRVLLTQWADYCCALMPGEPTCTEYLRNPESFIPSALPTAGSGASSTASSVGTSATTTTNTGGSSSTTPVSSKSEAFRSFRDRPAAALGSAISLVSLLIFL